MLHATVPGADAFGKHVEVMAVEMHGVCGGEGVFDDDADGGVGAEVVDVPLWVGRVGGVALVCEDEEGVAGWGEVVKGLTNIRWGRLGLLVVRTERLAIHEPDKVATGVLAEGDFDLLGCCRTARGREGEEGGGGS